MPHIFPIAEPSPDDRLAIVVSRWNESITGKLLDGAVRTLTEHGIPEQKLFLVSYTPGEKAPRNHGRVAYPWLLT